MHLVEHHANVTTIRNDAELHKEWRKTDLFAKNAHLHNYIKKEAMARQMLNMEVACRLAQQKKIDWILHIDIDELFYSPGRSVDEHFHCLSRRGQVFQQFMNYEGVPEKLHITDFFKDVTLFKKHPDFFSFFQRRRALKEFKTQKGLFNYYNIGKMAAVVNKIHTAGVHQFGVDLRETSWKAQFFSKQFRLRRAINRVAGSHEPYEPVILHYPVCGLDHFTDKYKTLGNFEDNWFGFQPIFQFHKSARDVIQVGSETTALNFYRQYIMMEKPRIEEFLAKGFLCRINFPMSVMEQFQRKVVANRT